MEEGDDRGRGGEEGVLTRVLNDELQLGRELFVSNFRGITICHIILTEGKILISEQLTN